GQGGQDRQVSRSSEAPEAFRGLPTKMTNTASPGRLSILAVVSFVLGLLAVTPPFLIIASLPALLLGLVSLRRINHSDGRLRGAWLAGAGMVLGALGTAASVVGVVALVALRLQEPARR